VIDIDQRTLNTRLLICCLLVCHSDIIASPAPQRAR
jgi:hypothetical protein